MSRACGPTLDEPLLLSRVGGNRRLALTLLREFSATHGGVVAEARRALRRGDANAAFRLLHRTAGTAGNLGLGPLSAAAARAEDALRATLAGGEAGAVPDLDAVEHRMRDAKDAIAEILAEDDPATRNAAPADVRRHNALLARLAEEVSSFSLSALDTAAELAPLLGEDGDRLADALARLDFPEAAGILGALQRHAETQGA